MTNIPETYAKRDWPRKVSRKAKQIENDVSALSAQVTEQSVPSGGSANDILTKDSGTDYDASWQAPADADLKPYCATGTGTDIPAAATQQDLSTEQVANANYALASDSVTVTAAGTYLISYAIQIDEDGTSGGTRGRATAYVTDDGVAIAQSYSGVYVRETSGGSGLSSSFVATLGAGSVLALFTEQDGTATTDISAERTQLSILKVN